MRKYLTPEIEMVEIDTEDVILASSGTGGNFGGGGNELPVIPRIMNNGDGDAGSAYGLSRDIFGIR